MFNLIFVKFAANRTVKTIFYLSLLHKYSTKSVVRFD